MNRSFRVAAPSINPSWLAVHGGGGVVGGFGSNYVFRFYSNAQIREGAR